MRRLVISAAMLGACTGDPESGALDGGPEPDATTGFPNVTVDAHGAQFIAYRDGDGPWQALARTADQRYELRVEHDYQLVLACSDDTGFAAVLYAWTLSDGASQFGFCPKRDPLATTVAITGEMAQAGTVTMGDSDSASVGPWSFALDVEPGIHDLIAVSSDGILIRRDQDISAAGAVDPVDVDEDGAPLVAVAAAVNGVEPEETLTTNLLLLTEHGGTSIAGPGTTVRTPPASILVAADLRIVSGHAETENTRRSGTRIFAGTEPTFTLPPALTGVSFRVDDGVVVGSWDALPAFTDVQLSIVHAEGLQYSEQLVVASSAWIDATGATELSFDTAVPGYDPSWTIALDGPQTRSLTVFSPAGPIAYSTATLQHLDGADD